MSSDKIIDAGEVNGSLQENEKETPPETSQEPIDPMYKGFVIVDGMKVGDIGLFVLNIVIASAIPIIGFATCYKFRNSHSAKYGSLVGLGITLIMYGFSVHPSYSRRMLELAEGIESLDVQSGFGMAELYFEQFTGNSYVASLIIGGGLAIIIRSVYKLYRVHQVENSMLGP